MRHSDRRWAEHLRDEDGQALVLVVLFLVFLLGCAAIVIDDGHVRAVRSGLQSAADAAALAGASALPDAPRALDEASLYGPKGENAQQGILDGSLKESLSTTCSSGSADCTSPDVLVVHESARVGTFFARVLGIDSLGVSVSAAACRDCSVIAATTCASGSSSVSTAFDDTPIPAGARIWFVSSLTADGVGPQGAAVRFTHQTITFAGRTIPVPDATVVLSGSADSATTRFDQADDSWKTTVPATLAGGIFLSGATFPVDSALPGGIAPVTWKGDFVTSVPGVTVDWHWGAAVYTTFADAYGDLGVKPTDDSSASSYKNSDSAGTPEAYKDYVSAGATG